MTPLPSPLSDLRTRTLLALVCLLLSLAPARGAASPGAAPPVATVGLVRGPARKLVLPPGGGSLKQAAVHRLSSLEGLEAGAFLQVGAGGTVVLVFHADGHREDLSGPCFVRVASRGCQRILGAANSVRLSESEVGEALSPDPVVRTRTTAGASLKVRTEDGVLRFSWSAPAAGPVTVSVYLPGPPRRNIWESEQLASSALYDGPFLLPDTGYVLQVEQQGQPVGALRFQVNSAGAVASLEAARAEVQQAPRDAASLALLAAAQDQQGDLPAAVQSMQAAVDLQPDDSAFVARMAEMVREMGDEARAGVLKNRAKELEDSFPGLSDADTAAMDLDLEGLPGAWWY